MTKTLILDPGYSSVKWAFITEDGKVEVGREPTAVAEATDWMDIGYGLDEENAGLRWKGKQFLVGKEALTAGLPIPTMAEGFLTELAVPLFLKKLLEGQEVRTIIILLSPADFGLKPEIEAAVKEALPENNSEIVFMPQGFGAWIAAGTPANCFVLDIGFNTVDCLPFINSKFRGDLSFALKEAGLVSFLSKIERDDPFLLSQKLEKGEKRLASILREHYWRWLTRQLEARREWRYRPGNLAFILCGGGSRFIKVKGAKVLSEPELANVRGVAKFILAKTQTGPEKTW